MVEETATARCLNCGELLSGPFCSSCGQRAIPANPTVAELTTAVRSLTKWRQDEQTTAQRAATELPRVLREEFTAPMKALNDSLRDLTKLMKEAHIDRVRATATLDDLMSRLTDRLTEQRAPSDLSRAEGRRFWPKRSIVSSEQPTA